MIAETGKAGLTYVLVQTLTLSAEPRETMNRAALKLPTHVAPVEQSNGT